MSVTDAEQKRIHDLVGKIQRAQSFDDVYKALDAKYVLHPEGSLADLPQNAFSLVCSVSVLEHVPRQSLKASIEGSFDVLKPGGYAIHMTDLGDHLTLYDPSMEYNKNYLQYSDTMWKLLLENDVQYFNRVQPAEFRKYFDGAGFKLEEEVAEPIDLKGTKISSSFAALERRDLEVLTLKTVHRKPL
jgi:SAM-dependent methyltransferase